MPFCHVDITKRKVAVSPAVWIKTLQSEALESSCVFKFTGLTELGATDPGQIWSAVASELGCVTWKKRPNSTEAN